MPALYRYVCRNPRCPWQLDKGEPFRFNAVPKKGGLSSETHFHCPYCQSGTDTHLEATPLRRVSFGEMSDRKDKPIRISEEFRRSTRRILPLPSESGAGPKR